MTVFNEPAEKPANGDQVAIDGGHGLPLVPPQIISEVGDVSGRDPTDGEPLAVAGGEPLGKLLDVVGESTPRMTRQVMGSKELAKQGFLVSPDRNALENIITTILHALTPIIGQQVDALTAQLG